MNCGRLARKLIRLIPFRPDSRDDIQHSTTRWTYLSVRDVILKACTILDRIYEFDRYDDQFSSEKGVGKHVQSLPVSFHAFFFQA